MTKTLQQLYSDHRTVINQGYCDYWAIIEESLRDREPDMSDEEIDDAVTDLIVSYTLGKVITYDEVINKIN